MANVSVPDTASEQTVDQPADQSADETADETVEQAVEENIADENNNDNDKVLDEVWPYMTPIWPDLTQVDPKLTPNDIIWPRLYKTLYSESNFYLLKSFSEPSKSFLLFNIAENSIYINYTIVVLF